MPEFEEWQVVNIQGLRPYVFELGVRRKGGKRTSFFQFDVRERNHYKDTPMTGEAAKSLVNSIAKQIIK